MRKTKEGEEEEEDEEEGKKKEKAVWCGAANGDSSAMECVPDSMELKSQGKVEPALCALECHGRSQSGRFVMESLTEEETLGTQVSQSGVKLWVGMGGGCSGYNNCQQKGKGWEPVCKAGAG